MTALTWVQLASLIIALSCMPFSAYWIRRAHTFLQIADKLRNHEPLTEREQQLLDKL